MAQEPPSTQGSSQGTIYWALNDPYSKVLGKEQSGRVRGVRSVHIPQSSACTLRMPLGTCNDPEHAGIFEVLPMWKKMTVMKMILRIGRMNSFAAVLGVWLGSETCPKTEQPRHSHPFPAHVFSEGSWWETRQLFIYTQSQFSHPRG